MKRTVICVLMAVIDCGMFCQKGPVETDRPRSIPYQWRETKMTGGGFITGIVFHPARRDLAYCRTDIGGAYRWESSQKRWLPLLDWVGSDDANLLGIEALAVDPTDPSRLYLSAGTYTSMGAPNGFVLRSRDQGRTFDRIAMPFKIGGNEDGRFSGDRMVVDPQSPNIVLLGSRNDGLWRSEDWGNSWRRLENFPFASTNRIGIVSVIFGPKTDRDRGHTRTIYASQSQVNGGLFRSDDAGEHWSRVEGQPTGLLITHAALSSDGIFYLTYGDSPGPTDMKRGSVWRFNLSSGGWTEITPASPDTSQAGFGYGVVALSPSDPTTVIVATLDRYHPHDAVFRSTDRGNHWQDIAGSQPHDAALSPWLRQNDGRQPGVGHWIGSLAIDPFHSGHVLYGTGETMWGTTEAASQAEPIHWTVAASGIEETAVLGLLSPPFGPALFSALGDISGFRHDSLELTPIEGNLRDPYLSNTTSIDFSAAAPNIMVRVGQVWSGDHHGGISRDEGKTWQVFPTEPPSPRGGGSIAISADGRNIIWAPYHRPPSYSRDDGRTWRASQGVDSDVFLFSDRVSGQILYAFNSHLGTLSQSENGGASFHEVGTGLPAGRGVRVALSLEDEFWISSPVGLVHSSSPQGPFVPIPAVQEAFAIGFGRPVENGRSSTLFLSGRIGGIAGIFRSTDHGETWAQIDDQDHHYGHVGVISGDPKVFGRVYLGTNGRGIPYGDPR
jgi:hypothetical protein